MGGQHAGVQTETSPDGEVRRTSPSTSTSTITTSCLSWSRRSWSSTTTWKCLTATQLPLEAGLLHPAPSCPPPLPALQVVHSWCQQQPVVVTVSGTLDIADSNSNADCDVLAH